MLAISGALNPIRRKMEVGPREAMKVLGRDIAAFDQFADLTAAGRIDIGRGNAQFAILVYTDDDAAAGPARCRARGREIFHKEGIFGRAGT